MHFKTGSQNSDATQHCLCVCVIVHISVCACVCVYVCVKWEVALGKEISLAQYFRACYFRETPFNWHLSSVDTHCIRMTVFFSGDHLLMAQYSHQYLTTGKQERSIRLPQELFENL